MVLLPRNKAASKTRERKKGRGVGVKAKVALSYYSTGKREGKQGPTTTTTLFFPSPPLPVVAPPPYLSSLQCCERGAQNDFVCMAPGERERKEEYRRKRRKSKREKKTFPHSKRHCAFVGREPAYVRATVDFFAARSRRFFLHRAV